MFEELPEDRALPPNPADAHAHEADDRTLLSREQSMYQLIELRRHPRFGNQLYLDGDLQISSSDGAYNTAMVAPLLGIDPLERVLILGGGDGGVLGELLKNPVTANASQLSVDLVDIDDRVLALAATHFREFSRGAFDDPRAKIVVGDAFAHVKTQRNLDAVVYDLTMDPIRDDQSRIEFIRQIIKDISASLRPGGVLSMQCCSAEESEDPASPNGELLAEIISTVREHFVALQMQKVYVPSYEELWVFLSGTTVSC